MKIGIDAKWFFGGPPSGTVVIYNILKYFIELTHGYELYIFLDQREKGKDFPFKSDQVHLVYVWADNNLISNVLILPYHSQQLKLDVCIFMNFAPPVINCKKIAFVFDVIFASNPEYFTLLERLYFSPIRFLARNADRVCTISHSEKDRMISYGFSEKQLIDVVSLGVDKKFRPRDARMEDQLSAVRVAYRLPPEFILYVGRLNIRKNIGGLLQALPLLRNTSIPLVIAGEQNWKMPDIESVIDELGIRDRLIFTGRVEESHIELLYALATIFAYPSFEEGFGLPPLEAMASGVPVVVSNSSALPEVCGDAAMYADPHDPSDVASKIDALLEDSDLYAAMSAKGIQRAQQFTWELSARQLLQSVSLTIHGNSGKTVMKP